MPRATNSRTPAPIWVHEPIITPELKVWRAVLEQAHQDAELSAGPEEDGAESSECTKARRYLRADSPHEAENLKLVCDFADVPADRVISWARRRYRTEQAFQKDGECGSRAAAFAAGHLWEPAKPDPGSRTPQIAA